MLTGNRGAASIFQALPHLYVTANLYLPKNLERPAPAILYVCGHSRMMTNGISCGSKAGYQRHGEWFARNGYVCLMIDMLQYAEIQGEHHGTHSAGRSNGSPTATNTRTASA